MLSILSGYDDVFGPLRILRYITLRTLLAAGTAALIGFIIGPWLIAHLRRMKFGQHYDDDRTGDLASRFDKKNTPTMGGLLIFACVLGSSLLWAAPNIWVGVALFVYTALTAVGFRDDYLKVVHKNRNGISSGAKIFWQTVITLVDAVNAATDGWGADVVFEASGSPRAYDANSLLEFQRNRERYAFLKWGQTAFRNFSAVPPGMGICHQVNLEYLARVVFTTAPGPDGKGTGPARNGAISSACWASGEAISLTKASVSAPPRLAACCISTMSGL